MCRGLFSLSDRKENKNLIYWKMASVSNAFPFRSSCAHRYFIIQTKPRRVFLLLLRLFSSCIHVFVEINDYKIKDVVESIMCFGSRTRAARGSHRACCTAVCGGGKKAKSFCSGNSVKAQRRISAISTNAIFPWAPILSTSGAERRRWEHYQMCLSSSRWRDPGGRRRYRVTFSAWFCDINAISCLITMGTFHRVLDLINDFFLGSHLSSPCVFFSFLLFPLPDRWRFRAPRFPCSWADNPTSPGAQPL